MAAGDSLEITVKAEKWTKGFEDEVSFTSLTQNGTFFNNSDIMPTLGYVRNYEIQDKNRRKKLGLPPRQRSPQLTTTTLRRVAGIISVRMPI
jgi:hypothetical protein